MVASLEKIRLGAATITVRDKIVHHPEHRNSPEQGKKRLPPKQLDVRSNQNTAAASKSVVFEEQEKKNRVESSVARHGALMFGVEIDAMRKILSVIIRKYVVGRDKQPGYAWQREHERDDCCTVHHKPKASAAAITASSTRDSYLAAKAVYTKSFVFALMKARRL